MYLVPEKGPGVSARSSFLLPTTSDLFSVDFTAAPAHESRRRCDYWCFPPTNRSVAGSGEFSPPSHRKTFSDTLNAKNGVIVTNELQPARLVGWIATYPKVPKMRAR